jgi:anti-sigma-K factor RsiG
MTTAPRPTLPEPSPHLQGLSLAELRAYRARLRAEEERTSYWRRLVHARIDLLEATGTTDGSLSLADLVRVLGDTGNGQVRHALHRVRAADPLPDLPALDEVWVVPSDEDERLDAVRRLRDAETQLTGYRSALHQRIDEATAELIVRYRQDPTQALAVLTV